MQKAIERKRKGLQEETV